MNNQITPEDSGQSDATTAVMSRPASTASQVEDAAVELIRSRGVVGRKKYRTSMDRRDLHPSTWARHLQEELADGIQYAERWRMIGDLLDDARAIMVNLRDEFGWECADEWIKAHDNQFYPENDQVEAPPRKTPNQGQG